MTNEERLAILLMVSQDKEEAAHLRSIVDFLLRIFNPEDQACGTMIVADGQTLHVLSLKMDTFDMYALIMEISTRVHASVTENAPDSNRFN